MARIASDLTELVGNLPLGRLNRVTIGASADAIVRLELLSPSDSLSYRIGRLQPPFLRGSVAVSLDYRSAQRWLPVMSGSSGAMPSCPL